jgi:hypothetical protein
MLFLFKAIVLLSVSYEAMVFPLGAALLHDFHFKLMLLRVSQPAVSGHGNRGGGGG